MVWSLLALGALFISGAGKRLLGEHAAFVGWAAIIAIPFVIAGRLFWRLPWPLKIMVATVVLAKCGLDSDARDDAALHTSAIVDGPIWQRGQGYDHAVFWAKISNGGDRPFTDYGLLCRVVDDNGHTFDLWAEPEYDQPTTLPPHSITRVLMNGHNDILVWVEVGDKVEQCWPGTDSQQYYRLRHVPQPPPYNRYGG